MKVSKVARLPREVLDELERAWRERRVGLDELVEFLKTRGADVASDPEKGVSRSGLHRYLSQYKRTFDRIREAQAVAGHCIEQLGENPRGEVGRLLTQVLSALALDSLNQVSEGTERIDSKELFFLSTAIKNLASAEKTSVDRELKIRKEVAAKVAAKVDQRVEEARASGVDLTILERAKELVRGALDG